MFGLHSGEHHVVLMFAHQTWGPYFTPCLVLDMAKYKSTLIKISETPLVYWPC